MVGGRGMWYVVVVCGRWSRRAAAGCAILPAMEGVECVRERKTANIRCMALAVWSWVAAAGCTILVHTGNINEINTLVGWCQLSGRG